MQEQPSPLNKISFEIIKLKSKIEYVEICIDDQPLIKTLRTIELPYAIKEGSKSIAGGYIGLQPETIFLPSQHLFDKPETMFQYDEKVAILECECGVSGCWPFLVNISIDDKFVVWDSFEQPHRKEKWNYDQLPVFRFDKTQYKRALSKDPKYFKS